MNRKLLIISLLALLTASCTKEVTPSGVQNPATSDQCGDFTSGELLIKFSPEMTQILDNLDVPKTRSGIPSTDEVLDIIGAYSLQRVFPIDPRSEARTREAGLHLWYLVQVPEETDLAAACTRLARLGEISKVQCNRLIYRRQDLKPTFISCEQADAQAPALTKSGSHPVNDPYLYCQWHYINDGSAPFERDWAPVVAGADVNCEPAWQLCTGDPSIIVAVLDEGVMYNHPDLAANMWVNEVETMGSSADVDGNGYKGDRYGYNFTRNTGAISFNGVYDMGHGTHVAGSIAAVNSNGIGVSGIAGGDGTPNSGVKIMTLQVFDNGYTCTVANEARAMKYAADNGAVIMQCSWGYNSCLSNILMGFTPGPATEEEWYKSYPLEKEAIDYFIHNAGSPNGVIDGGLIFFASGNEYAAMSAFPAAYSECVSVSAIAADYTPASYANYGTEVELCAPGGDIEYYCNPGRPDDTLEEFIAQSSRALSPQGSILSTIVLDGKAGYGYYDGTSMACPHVAGVAALGLSYAAKMHRHYTAAEFKQLMKDTARDMEPYLKGEKRYYYNHTSAGASPTKMNLASYRGKMGRLVDAGALLAAVAGGGSDMKVPNFYLAPMQTEKLNLAAYFDGGEVLTYQAECANTKIAQVKVSGTVLMVTGISEGMTSVKITPSSGNPVTVSIVVRKNSSGNGWL